MKKNKLLSLIILLLISINSIAQQKYNYKRVWKWEGVTKNHQVVFGVAPTKYQAQLIINDFNKRNEQNNYKLIHYKNKSEIVKYVGEEDYFDTFQKQIPKKYVIITIPEQNAIKFFQKEGFHNACTYYSKARSITYPLAQKHLENLFTKYCPYKLKFKTIKNNHWVK